MFCVMDVSGSMDEGRKSMAKRFFILLYLFSSRAATSNRGGLHPPPHRGQGGRRGRVLPLARVRRHRGLQRARADAQHPARALRQRQWNVYGAQASDGDNWDNDSPVCGRLLGEILPLVPVLRLCRDHRRRAAEPVARVPKLEAAHDNFAMQRIESPADIYPVFRELFKKTLA